MGSAAVLVHNRGTDQVLDSRYRVGQLILSNARERLFRGIDLENSAQVEILFLHSDAVERLPSSEFKDLLKAELNYVQLYHFPGIALPVGGGIADGQAYLVYPVFSGVTLSSLFTAVEPSVSRGESLARALLAVLVTAHDAGVTHLDLTPDNILVNVSGGQIERLWLRNLGAARLRAAKSTNMVLMTKSGQTVAAPEYMSPELFSGRTTDLRSDLYSAGAILFESVMGQPPFVADSMIDMLLMHLNQPLPNFPGDSEDPGAEALLKLIARLLIKDPEQRPQSAGEALQELYQARPAIIGREADAAEVRRVLPDGTAMDIDFENLSSELMRDLQADAADLQEERLSERTKIWVLRAAVGSAIALCLGMILVLIYAIRNVPAPAAPPPDAAEEPEMRTQLKSRNQLVIKSGGEAEVLSAKLEIFQPDSADEPSVPDAAPDGQEVEIPALGISVKPAIADAGTKNRGVRVEAVGRDSAPYRAGLRKSDLIYKVESRGENILVWSPQAVSSAADLEDALAESIRRKVRLALIIQRGGFESLVVFVQPKAATRKK